MSATLLYLSSNHIVDFVTRHPIDWSKAALAGRGGIGDQAGVPPTPSVHEFLSLLHEKKSLFTQAEYAEYCFLKWKDWLKDKPPKQLKGLTAKLYRNFYPAMIDTLHAWSLLVEFGHFDMCMIDSYDDAVAKTDLTLQAQNLQVKIALLGPTIQAKRDRRYKLNHRSNGHDQDVVEVQMPRERPRQPGNKRWFKLEDFAPVIDHMSRIIAENDVLQLKKIQDLWPELWSEIKKADSMTGALLKDCYPTQVENHMIVLAFCYPFHFQRVLNAKCQAIANTVIRQKLGIDNVGIKCILVNN